MKKLAIAFAFALALLSAAPSGASRLPQAHESSTIVLAQAALPVSAPVVAADAVAIPLSRAEMAQVRGAGWWTKIKNMINKLVKWITANGPAIVQIINSFDQSTTTTFDASLALDRTDTYDNTTTTNEYYSSSITEIVPLSTDQSSTGDVLTSTTYSGGGGGGGGGTCITADGCTNP